MRMSKVEREIEVLRVSALGLNHPVMSINQCDIDS
jgi:hypothetical protein